MIEFDLVKVRQIASYFFFIEYYYDNEKVITEAEKDSYFKQAMAFLEAVNALEPEFITVAGYDPTKLSNPLEEIKVQEAFYNVGKRFYGTDKKELLTFFRHIYMMLFGTETGPRIGTFATILGIEEFLFQLEANINHPFDKMRRPRIAP